MEYLNRNEKGVSPVIATILLVAITVVVAGTLWVMISDFGEQEEDRPLTVNFRIDDGELNEESELVNFTAEIVSMSRPGSAEPDELDLRVIYERSDGVGEKELEIDIDEDGEPANGHVSTVTGVVDGEIVDGTTIYFEDIELEDAEELDSVELRVDEYDGWDEELF